MAVPSSNALRPSLYRAYSMTLVAGYPALFLPAPLSGLLGERLPFRATLAVYLLPQFTLLQEAVVTALEKVFFQPPETQC